MKIYLVGGAVRDQMLGLPVTEKDWVVVGATMDDMLRQGFRPVGKDFPVFLHPQTHEEYALARTERKVGPGYTGFDFDASAKVTLEEDLMRRDLTINAMAQTIDGQLIDPYHGAKDVQEKILRHVSPAFIEDPVRILRVARFAARYAYLGFQVAPETNALMQKMVFSGEVDALVAERVWKELERALTEKNPEQFFQVLEDCDALPVLFPMLSTESLGMQALLAAAKITSKTAVRFAALLHDIPEADINAVCERYRIPSDYRELALLVVRCFPMFQKADTLSAAEIVELLQTTDAFRREARFKKFLLACEAAALPQRLAQSNLDAPLFSVKLLKCYEAAKKVDAQTFLTAGFAGKELAEQIKQERIKQVALVLQAESGQVVVSKKLH